MIRAALVIAAMAVFATESVANAETADDIMDRALKEFMRGEWEKSATMLRAIAPKLTDAKRRATAWKTIGLAEIERRRVADAEAAFVEALTADPLADVDPVEDTPAAVALFRSVRNRLEGRLVVTANRADARLSLDGVDHGPLPFGGAVKVGRRKIRAATTDGHYVLERDDVVVRVGQTLTLRLTLAPKVAFLTVRGTGGATVSIDGTAVGKAPLTRSAVAAGRHIIEVARDGFVSRRVDAIFGLGEEKVVDGILAPIIGVPVVARGADEPRVVRAPVSRKTRSWGIAALGVGVATLLAGVLTYVVPETPSMSGFTRDEYAGRVGSFNTTIKVGIGLLVGGGIVLAGSGVLFALHRDDDQKPKVSESLSTIARVPFVSTR